MSAFITNTDDAVTCGGSAACCAKAKGARIASTAANAAECENLPGPVIARVLAELSGAAKTWRPLDSEYSANSSPASTRPEDVKLGLPNRKPWNNI